MVRSRLFLRPLLLAGATLVVLFSALWCFSREYQAVLSFSGTTNDIIDSLTDERFDLPHPESARTFRDILSTCGRILTISPRLKSDANLAERVAQTCGKISRSVLSTAPANGRAMAVELLTVKRIAVDRLRTAQSAAPNEPWALNIRLQAIAADGFLDPVTGEAAAEDIRRAMLSQWGKEALAGLYIARPAFRPLVSRVAEQADRSDQRRFLEILRRETGGRF